MAANMTDDLLSDAFTGGREHFIIFFIENEN
jgi:hypothetical protein